MVKERKSRAFNPAYQSTRQMVLTGFETPFERELNPANRWVVLAKLIPWDDICPAISRKLGDSSTGRPSINARIVLGSLIIKYLCDLDDRETVDQISENVYMQYFLGYSSFIDDKPFDASLFVDFRKKLGFDTINAINEKIVKLKTTIESKKKDDDKPEAPAVNPQNCAKISSDRGESEATHKGKVILDATACPQNIAYPTDLNLLNDARKKSEELIDFLYRANLHGSPKPRTYRREARKYYLQTAQKKNKTRKSVRKAVGKQLRYLRRNIATINTLLDKYERIPFDRHQLKYFYVIQALYDQQKTMYDTNTHSIEHRIVSIHQPHVRPIVRGKDQAKVEFGSKINISVVDGISFVDELSWDAFNEGNRLVNYVEEYRRRFGFYPREVLADKIYCTRANRAWLKEKGISLKGKPLGRPSSASAVSIHVSPGERNPVEGKFGQAKTGYGLNCIKARLKITSESWIAGIFLVLNLVKLAGAALPCLIIEWLQSLTAAWRLQVIFVRRQYLPIRCMA